MKFVSSSYNCTKGVGFPKRTIIARMIARPKSSSFLDEGEIISEAKASFLRRRIIVLPDRRLAPRVETSRVLLPQISDDVVKSGVRRHRNIGWRDREQED